MLIVYNIFTILIYPVLFILLLIRKIFHKENAESLYDKCLPSRKLNKEKGKKIIWFHAASIGEVQSIFPLIDRLNHNYKNLEFLITSNTISSGKIVKQKISSSDNIRHRYFPLDIFFLIQSFLNIWKPSLAIFVDSEIWPGFLSSIKKRKIPLVLINGRITKKTYNRWKYIDFFSKKIFQLFDLCLASSEESHNHLAGLKAKNIKYIGNLKYCVNHEFTNLSIKNKLHIKSKKTWCAASTHKGEEEFCFKVHKKIKKIHKNLLTIIIPRHIVRSKDIQSTAKKMDLEARILSKNEDFEDTEEIIIINSFGELSKYFNDCDNVFMGKSIVDRLSKEGGQNPIEAAKRGCKIFHGPYFYNFNEVYKHLQKLGIADEISSEEELAEKLIKNFSFKENFKKKNIELINNHGDEILNKTIKEINKFINL